MNNPDHRESKRFNRSVWTERLVPLALGALGLILLGVIVLVGLAAFGLI